MTCCTFKNWVPSAWLRIPTIATMPTVLWETLRCFITLHCVVRLRLITSWPSMFLSGSAILHANDPFKNVSSEFVLLCKKAEPLLFIQATPKLVLSALFDNFANKVACFRLWHDVRPREAAQSCFWPLTFMPLTFDFDRAKYGILVGPFAGSGIVFTGFWACLTTPFLLAPRYLPGFPWHRLKH